MSALNKIKYSVLTHENLLSSTKAVKTVIRNLISQTKNFKYFNHIKKYFYQNLNYPFIH